MQFTVIANSVLVASASIYLLVAAYQEFSHKNVESGKTVISMMAAGSRDQKMAYEQVIAAFETQNPDLRVRLEWGTSGDYFGVLLTRMAGGIPPDVAWMYEFKMPYFAEKGGLLDLTLRMQRDFKDELKDFHPRSLDVFSYRGRMHAMPVGMAPVLLFYNKKIFDEAGEPYPDARWSWDKLRQVAIKLTRRDAAGRVIRYGLAGTVHWEMMEMPSGKRRLGTDLAQPLFDDPALIESVEFFTDLVLKDRVAPDAAAAQQQSLSSLFESGQAAMSINGRWMVPTYNKIPDFDYDVAPIPFWKEGRRVTYTHAVGYSIPAGSRHQEEAWRFVKFLGSREAQMLLTRLGDTVPVRLSVLRSPVFLTPQERPAHDELFAEALDYSAFVQVVDPLLPDFYRQAIESVMAGQTTVGDAMREVKRKIARVVSEEHPVLLK